MWRCCVVKFLCLFVFLFFPSIVSAQTGTVSPAIVTREDCTGYANQTNLCRDNDDSVLYQFDGDTVIAVGSGLTETQDLQDVVTLDPSVTSAASVGTGVYIGDTVAGRLFYTEGSGATRQRSSNAARTVFTSIGLRAEVGSDIPFANEDGDTCLGWDSSTFQLTVSTTANCADTFDIVGSATFSGSVTVADEAYTASGFNGDVTAMTKNAFHDEKRRADTVVTSSPYTLLDEDCGHKVFNNVAGALEVDLLADMTGCNVVFFNLTANTLTIDPNSTDTLIVASAYCGTPAAGDAVQLANLVGNSIGIGGISATQSAVFSGQGTCTDVN